MSRTKHPKSDIEAALRFAEAAGWVVRPNKRGHRWGMMLCPHHERDGCRKGVDSTPRSPGDHAKVLRAAVDACEHRPDEG